MWGGQKMRRLVLVVGAASAVLAALAFWFVRAIPAVPGNLPGGALGSAINTWLNGPGYKPIADLLDPRPEDEVLDVACGDGAFLAQYAQPARYVAGLDLYDVKVGLARQRLAERIAAGTAEGDAAALPWEDSRFSALTCMDAFSFFPDPDRCLREFHRVLRPGGRAVMGIGMQMPEGSEPRRAFGHLSQNEEDVRRMVEAAGFEVSMAYRPAAGDNQLGNAISRRLFGTDQVRFVTAIKPAPVQAEEYVARPEAIAVS
jgi:SAM-dependent methyltransferase